MARNMNHVINTSRNNNHFINTSSRYNVGQHSCCISDYFLCSSILLQYTEYIATNFIINNTMCRNQVQKYWKRHALM